MRNNLSFVGLDVYNDLEFFHAFSHNYDHTIMSIFDKYCVNKQCRDNIVHTIKHPIYNIESLQRVQLQLRNMIHIYTNEQKEVDMLIERVKRTEKDVLWLLDRNQEDDVVKILDIAFFDLYLFKKLGFNQHASFLFVKNVYTIAIAPLIAVFSPLMYILIPYFIIIYKLKFKIPIGMFIRTFIRALVNNYALRKIFLLQCVGLGMSLFVYGQTLLNTFELAKNNYKVVQHLVEKVNNISLYIQSCERLNHLFNLEPFKQIRDCHQTTFNFGSQLVFFKNIDMIEFRLFLRDVNQFFEMLTIARLYTNHRMCFAEFRAETDNKTYIETKKMYHISIDKYVPNDIILDGTSCIITGPNAAGKSTFIKGILLNIIMSQTYGISFAETFVLTPFYFINSQINIPDFKGKQSLFEAEMYRCKQCIDVISELSNTSDKKVILFMDEVFNSTNVVEGISGAFGILKKISTYTNVCAIVTTHLLYLTKLPKYHKYKMNVNITPDDHIDFPYLLEKGVSKQLIALELIKPNFDEDVINTAISVKNKLLV